MTKGELTLDDFLLQMNKLKGMGSVKSMLSKIPGMAAEIGDMEIDDGEFTRMEGIVHSMTRKERANPSLIDASRRRRISRGAGCETEDVSGLVKTFGQMRDAMKSMAGMNMLQRMRYGTQLSKMAMSGGMRKLKASTKARKRQQSKKDRRKNRKRR
jgi:signal recognition particle subunit SRP54